MGFLLPWLLLSSQAYGLVASLDGTPVRGVWMSRSAIDQRLAELADDAAE